MNYTKANNITGWIVFAIAAVTYIATAEASGSFWDAGEFVASAYKLQLPHPPGAPVFTLIGRFFVILFGDNPDTAARAVNVMSALASAFTILFLFWTITHFARKMMVSKGEVPQGAQVLAVMASGVVGALAYSFSDSFWFSGVEGEVYALSSFFTALVFWAALKWERADELAGTNAALKARADRWIIFIFFMMGLSIGVHLLNLLTIPAIVMIYYYRRYNYTRNGAIWAFLIGCLITGVVQVAVIQWTIKLAGQFDILFVNSFGLPFFTGFAFFFLLLTLGVVFGLKYARRKNIRFLQLGLWCFAFMMIGYSAYVTTLERSNANPGIDMNNVDNPMSLVYYLGREQYGSAPLIYGPHFQAEYDYDESGRPKMDEGAMRYAKNKEQGRYVEIGRSSEPEYRNEDKQLFPRVWDRSNDQGHADFYADWLGLERSQNPQTGETKYEAPNFGDNLNWFFTYQMGFMYWRYFMWNFAGKQNDVQGFGNKRDGNWVSGISLIDNMRLGDQDRMPESLKVNKAKNYLFFIPFFLGVVGAVAHFMTDRKDWIINFLLFFFTGLAIVLYLNQPGSQPRERDYAFVGSFYAFAVWIGLSVLGFIQFAKNWGKSAEGIAPFLAGSITTFIITLLSNTTTTPGAAIGSSLFTAVLYGAFAAAITLLVRAVSGKGTNNLRTAVLTAGLVAMVAPVVMAVEVWDDHDRSEKRVAPAMARNYLESCAPNAILFTFGDNDTYPLWYAQEVENVRPDIRIINTSLLGIDWYVNQLRYKVNESAPIDVVWTPEQIQGLAYIQYQPGGNEAQYYDLYDVMKNVIGRQSPIATFPVRKFRVPVNAAEAAKSGAINPGDSVMTDMLLDLPPRGFLTLDQLTILNIIAANNWKRPIYFTSPYGELGFGNYFRKDGMTYRLVPVKTDAPEQNWLVDQALRGGSVKANNSDVMFKNLMTQFSTGGAEKPDLYVDETARQQLLNVRAVFAEAAGNMADKGRKPEAVQLLAKSESIMNTGTMPYAMASRFNSHNQTGLMYLEAAYKAGDKALAQKIKAAVDKDLRDQKAYYDYLKGDKPDFYNSIQREDDINNFLIDLLQRLDQQYNGTASPVIEQPRRAADSTRKF